MSAMATKTRFIFSVLALASLAGCTIAGGPEDLEGGDITTGSVASPEAAIDPTQLSDSRTVRNAVSAASLSADGDEKLAWANADTGTSGTITAIQEVRAGDQICRQFTTSRRRFDGISLFSGEACTAGHGEWTLTRFSEGG